MPFLARVSFALLCLFGSLVLRAQSVVDSDILRYGVAKVRSSHQTSLTETVPQHYRFEAFVHARPDGTVNLARVQGPTVSAQLLQASARGWNFRSNFYENEGELDIDFPNFANEPNGNYTVRIDSGAPNGGGFDYAVAFRFGSADYPSANPVVSAGAAPFINGRFVVDVGLAATFTFDFADYNPARDFVIFRVQDAAGNVVHDQFFYQTPAAPTGVEFLAHAFEAGEDYTGTLMFGRVVDDSTEIVGADGFAYFGRETTFTFTAIPEPSVYAALLGAACAAALVLRRRRTIA